MSFGVAIGWVMAQVGAWLGGVSGDALSVSTLLSRMRSAYASAGTARLSAVITFYPSPEQVLRLSLEMEYIKPDRVRVLLSSGEERVLVVSDGKVVSVVHEPSGSRLLNPFSLEHLNASVPGNLETICFWDWRRQLSSEGEGKMAGSQLRLLSGVEWNGKKWVVLEERDEKLDLLVKYYVDPKTFLIMRTVVYGLARGSLYQEAQVVALEAGIKLEEERFRIVPFSGGG